MRRQRAQVLVWVVVMLPFFLAIVGLSIDAGRLFDARRGAWSTFQFMIRERLRAAGIAVEPDGTLDSRATRRQA